MVEQIEKIQCTGCGACANICPQDAIYMEADCKGFLYPKVEAEKCINCGLCLKRCPAINALGSKDNYSKPQVYAAWSLNEETRINSTSGGIFSELAIEILSRGGYVVGARYTKNHLVEHYAINTVEQLQVLRQSKYIQSEIGQIYKKVQEIIKEEKEVLFVGSPCEISGLRSYLGKDYENLILCDFVCRGTNSPKAYTQYLKNLENKFGSKIKKVWFKNKAKGWNLFSTKIVFDNGQEYIQDRNHDPFMLGYIHYNLFMRDCCSHCKYKTLPRVADITLADFWGVGNHRPDLDEDKGTSLVMINSNKGCRLYERIQKQVNSLECPLDWAIEGNVCILNVAKKNKYSDQFFEELEKIPFDKLIKKYVRKNQKRSFKDIIDAVIRRI